MFPKDFDGVRESLGFMEGSFLRFLDQEFFVDDAVDLVPEGLGCDIKNRIGLPFKSHGPLQITRHDRIAIDRGEDLSLVALNVRTAGDQC